LEDPRTQDTSSFHSVEDDTKNRNQIKMTEANEAKLKEELEVEEEQLDEEGLKKKGYDVVLFGTGLTQSILASALARAGKSILHCDGNDFYGEKDAVMSFGSMMDWYSEKNSANADKNVVELNTGGVLSSFKIHSISDHNKFQFKEEMEVVTPYGVGIVQSLPFSQPSDKHATTNSGHHTSSLVIKLNKWVMANGKSPAAYFGYHENNLSNEQRNLSQPLDISQKEGSITKYFVEAHDIIPTNTFQYQKYILAQKRFYALDLTPGLLYANGDAVNGMIESGVSEYCEFKSLLGLYLFMNDSNSSRIKKSTDSTNTQKFQLSRVPCSKRDVFQTKLLSPVDKRKLMKFLQIASDYAVAKSSSKSGNDGVEGEDKEEADSTKSTDSDVADSSSSMDKQTQMSEEEVVTSLNERQLQQGRSLYRPQNKAVSTSELEVLQECIKDGMDFNRYLEVEHKLTDRLRNIVIYAMALGSHNHDSNTYSTKEGMNDLSQHLQSLGRYGGTAFLVPIYGTGELSQAFCRSAAVHGGTYLLRRGVSKVLLENDDLRLRGVVLEDSNAEKKIEKEIATQHVVVPSTVLVSRATDSASKSRVYRRISILRGKLVHDAGSDGGNGIDQRHVIIVPPHTVGNANVIHGIALDESVNVAPSFYDSKFTSTVLHLTTIIDNDDHVSSDVDILQNTVQSLIQNQLDSSKTNLEEIHHFSFSFDNEDPFLEGSQLEISTNGLHVCKNQGHSITVEAAFREAEMIFKKICPRFDFLKLSNEMEEIVKETRFGTTEDDDHEKMMLESAMNMMTSTADKDSKIPIR